MNDAVDFASCYKFVEYISFKWEEFTDDDGIVMSHYEDEPIEMKPFIGSIFSGSFLFWECVNEILSCSIMYS